ncbi:hypothetical protein [Flavobacteriaceae bacterium 14752]|uniref:hypothetical protein n=1 Tax=Mesohalobacter salilacus TaxID=2491711 RepID=UPI000F6391DA|nr:hypothetical protein EIG84_05830 [Flavobacteriaceae bacterium 14752]
MLRKKCICGEKNSNGSCKNCSKIKMIPLLKNDEFKINHSGTGKLINPVFYSYLKQNHKSNEVIITGMLNRFQKQPIYKASRYIDFYDNQTKTLIHRHEAY